MIAPTMLTTRVIASSTKAAYINTPTSFGTGLGKVVGQQGRQRVARREQRQLSWLALPTSIASAMVSPRARPKARMIAAEDAARRRGQRSRPGSSPSASPPARRPPSRSLGGTDTSASRQMAEIVGRIMIASTSDRRQHAGPAQAGAEERNPAQLHVQPVGTADE